MREGVERNKEKGGRGGERKEMKIRRTHRVQDQRLFTKNTLKRAEEKSLRFTYM
jgi:hypothetical protein